MDYKMMCELATDIQTDGNVFYPTQEDLQNMVTLLHPDNKPISKLSHFFFWLCHYNRLGIADDYSFEQMWLIYVMEEKYSKTWNGSSWIKM